MTYREYVQAHAHLTMSLSLGRNGFLTKRLTENNKSIKHDVSEGGKKRVGIVDSIMGRNNNDVDE